MNDSKVLQRNTRAVKKNEADPYGLMWIDLQYVLLREKSKVQIRIQMIIPNIYSSMH